MKSTSLAVLFLSAAACATSPAPAPQSAPRAVSLFNGSDLSGWRIPEGDNGHWKVLDGVIDYDARSEAPGKVKDLWTEKEYRDFVLELEWRIKETPSTYPTPTVLPDGSHLRDASGKETLTELPNADSGIYLRGNTK